jgi:hypothetical protein|tara:strand:- start:115 stop:249 length:135 start_codon:yes stop_codon:yes gene_type:complete
MSFTGEVRLMSGIKGKSTRESLEIRAKALQYGAVFMNRASVGHF